MLLSPTFYQLLTTFWKRTYWLTRMSWTREGFETNVGEHCMHPQFSIKVKHSYSYKRQVIAQAVQWMIHEVEYYIEIINRADWFLLSSMRGTHSSIPMSQQRAVGPISLIRDERDLFRVVYLYFTCKCCFEFWFQWNRANCFYSNIYWNYVF